MMPIERPEGATRTRRRGRDVGRGRSARSIRRSSTATTSRRRSRSRLTADCGWPCARPPRSSASRRLASSGRWTPAFFDLKIALDNSRLNQTYNTPPWRPLHLLGIQIKWFNDNGGLAFSTGRSRTSGARSSTPGPKRRTSRRHSSTKPEDRSNVVGTIDFRDDIDANADRHDPARERRGRHRPLSQSSAATSCASRCSRASTPRTSRHCARASTGSSATSSRPTYRVLRAMTSRSPLATARRCR